MNWKDAPHLFAGGAFKIRFGDKIVVDFNHFQLGQVMDNPDWYKLIARPIADMTDEEIAKINWGGKKSWENKQNCEDNTLFAFEMLYLLSIGVYPFDQTSFDTGDVIDIKQLQGEG